MPDPSGTGTSTDNLTFLCFDFGLRRIGVAVGQTVTLTASPLQVIGNNGDRWRCIEQLLHQWQPHALIVGIPLDISGAEQPMTASARKFARQLHGRFGLPVHSADERFSSREAQDRFRQQRRQGDARQSQADREDAVAAQIILEQWFNDHIAGP
jgi:putative Holliday junction resolvase